MNALRKKPKLKKVVAISLVCVGVVGVVLPVLPGPILIGVGLYLLSVDSPHVQGKIHAYRTKHKALDHALKHSYDRLHAKHTVTKEV